ncbi:MAG: hypothetical protein ABSA06_07995 [Geobacteraceae bacterium]
MNIDKLAPWNWFRKEQEHEGKGYLSNGRKRRQLNGVRCCSCIGRLTGSLTMFSAASSSPQGV